MDAKWFVIKAGEHAGRWHMAGWKLMAIKCEDTSIPGGATDRTRGWLELGICPQCSGLVMTDDQHAYGDQQWAHEDWHHLTDYPHPMGE